MGVISGIESGITHCNLDNWYCLGNIGNHNNIKDYSKDDLLGG